MEKYFRALVYYIRVQERRLINRIRRQPHSLAGRFVNLNLILFNPRPLRRGMAIGMFWGFMPMPFQMLPAAICCWLTRANLPSAILCVWLSNPFTYVPIFYVEYQLGVFLFGEDNINWQTFSEMFVGEGQSFLYLFETIGSPLLLGALVIGTTAAVGGYFSGILMFYYLDKRHKSQRGYADEN